MIVLLIALSLAPILAFLISAMLVADRFSYPRAFKFFRDAAALCGMLLLFLFFLSMPILLWSDYVKLKP